MNELVKFDHDELARFRHENGEIFGLENTTAEDLVLPRWKANGKEGRFINELDGNKRDELNCTLISRNKERVKWVPDEEKKDGEDPFDCTSKDSVTGSKHGDCQTCQYRNKDCKSNYDFLILEDTASIPAMLRTSGTSYWAAKNYLQFFNTNHLPLFVVNTRLTFTEEVNKDNKSYYKVKLENTGKSDSAKWDAFAKLVKDFSGKDAASPPIEEEYAPEGKDGKIPF